MSSTCRCTYREQTACTHRLPNPRSRGPATATLTPELQAVEKAHDLLGLTYREIADAINATESMLHRWRKSEGPDPTPVCLARLEALPAFLIELWRTFRDWNDARVWLDQEISFLQGRTPRDRILNGHVDRVTGVLFALNAGIPT